MDSVECSEGRINPQHVVSWSFQLFCSWDWMISSPSHKALLGDHVMFIERQSVWYCEYKRMFSEISSDYMSFLTVVLISTFLNPKYISPGLALYGPNIRSRQNIQWGKDAFFRYKTTFWNLSNKKGHMPPRLSLYSYIMRAIAFVFSKFFSRRISTSGHDIVIVSESKLCAWSSGAEMLQEHQLCIIISK